MPDREELIEQLIVIRRQMNIANEQNKLLRTSVHRSKQTIEKLQKDTHMEKEAFNKQPDWIKHKDPGSAMFKVLDPRVMGSGPRKSCRRN